jgi:hypothetical protein
MSHIVTIKTEVKDQEALRKACQRLRLEAPTQGRAKLYSASATGTIVKLPGWNYPVVFDTKAGSVAFDNYNGAWGAQSELDKLMQAYAIEKASAEARREGHSVTEQTMANGSVKLTVHVGA